MGLRSGLCTGQSSSSTPFLTQPFGQERAFPKLLGKHRII
uniref:Uncharacterized protein n=1 Tax=Anguilla anguilla TaxID=7936 RepID=A0A0E9U576_ANGAN